MEEENGDGKERPRTVLYKPLLPSFPIVSDPIVKFLTTLPVATTDPVTAAVITQQLRLIRPQEHDDDGICLVQIENNATWQSIHPDYMAPAQRDGRILSITQANSNSSDKFSLHVIASSISYTSFYVLAELVQ